VKVDPNTALDIRHGDRGYIVFEYSCIDVHTPAVNRDDPGVGGVLRIPVLVAGTATFLDDEVVATAIDNQRERNARFQEMQEGQARIEDELLIEAHDRGEHAEGIVDYCPRCLHEIDLALEEEAETNRAEMHIVTDPTVTE
jgi:hypothetical protein